MVLSLRFATVADIDDMIVLDKMVYHDEYFVTRQKVEQALQRNSYLYRVLLQDGVIVGYHSEVPLLSSDLDLVIDGSMQENEIILHTQPYNNSGNHIYMNSIVVSPEVHNQESLGYRLCLDFFRFMGAVHLSGRPITRMVGIPVSYEGLRMSNLAGMKKVTSFGMDGDLELCSMLVDSDAMFGKKSVFNRKKIQVSDYF